MEFSRQGYWSGLPFPSPGDPPNPGMEPDSPALAGGFFIADLSGKPKYHVNCRLFTDAPYQKEEDPFYSQHHESFCVESKVCLMLFLYLLG